MSERPAAPPPPTRSTDAPPAAPRRLPQLDDFPEAGPNALATFQQRGWARLADEIVVTLPLTIAMVAVQAAAGDSQTGVSGAAGEVPWPLLAGAFAVQILYEVAGVALFGATVGKWVLGVRVARYTDGGRPTWAQATLRCLVWAVPAAATLALLKISLVGAAAVFLSAWSNPLRRGWHDDAGGTVVVRTR